MWKIIRFILFVLYEKLIVFKSGRTTVNQDSIFKQKDDIFRTKFPF